MGKRHFTALMCKKAVDDIIDGINKDCAIRNKRGAAATAETVLTNLIGEEISLCDSPNYTLLSNGSGVAKVALWADQAKALGVKPILHISYVQSWRGSFDPKHPTYMGDYHSCKDPDTVFFLDCVNGILQKYPQFCDDPLSSCLVLEVANWDDICATAKRSEAWVKGANTDFHKSIEGALQRRLDKASIPSAVLQIDRQNIAYRLRAFRSIVKRYNSLSKKFGYPPIKIPKYILDL